MLCVHLGRDLPLRFVIVGGGNARIELERHANEVNTELGRSAVVLTGPLLDPRPAYASADIVIGMGGSALRGMASGKPVIIVGEQGFAAPFDTETAQSFLYKGIYGIGNGSPDNTSLVNAIRALAERSEQFSAIGEFSRQFVQEHFALETVSARLEKFLSTAAAERPKFRVALADGLRTAAVWLRERRFITPCMREWIRKSIVKFTTPSHCADSAVQMGISTSRSKEPLVVTTRLRSLLRFRIH